MYECMYIYICTHTDRQTQTDRQTETHTHTAELLVYNHIHWYILSNIQLGLGNSMSVLVLLYQ
jgi:hypothetical protein